MKSGTAPWANMAEDAPGITPPSSAFKNGLSEPPSNTICMFHTPYCPATKIHLHFSLNLWKTVTKYPEKMKEVHWVSCDSGSQSIPKDSLAALRALYSLLRASQNHNNNKKNPKSSLRFSNESWIVPMEGQVGRIRDATLTGLETGNLSIYGTTAQESSAMGPCGCTTLQMGGQKHVATFCTKQDHVHNWIKTNNV